MHVFSALSLKQSITQCLKLSLCYLLRSREFIDTLAGKSNKRRDLFMHLNKYLQISTVVALSVSY